MIRTVTIISTTVLVAFFILLGIAATRAQGPCAPYAPYYHSIETGPGAMLGDLFFFVGSLPHTIILVGGPSRPVQNTRTREVRRVSTAACMPITTAQHFGQTRPPHVEHWRAE